MVRLDYSRHILDLWVGQGDLPNMGPLGLSVQPLTASKVLLYSYTNKDHVKMHQVWVGALGMIRFGYF